MARRLGSNDRQRERATQQALQTRIANRFEVGIRRQIAGAMRDAAQMVQEGGDFTSAVRGHEEALQALLIRDWQQASRLLGNRILNAAKSAHGEQWVRKQSPDDVFNHAIDTFIQNLTARKVVEISRTTEGQLRNIVNRGIDEGLSVEQIGRLIRSETTIRASLRAHVIARTETHSAAGFGSQAAAVATGLPLRKEWIAARDDRTRDDEFDHFDADGEMIGIDEPFTRTGEALMYPGDPMGSAGNIINCRCASGYLFED